ncbi:hypothetical protein UCRPC4_g03750 [Phaeomoniella chlamydospora]|uniref:Uncharacterized protein n=1 Tax=Phaeomoniella chlamydospora TaxID=158046 RepID=A0A0G2EFV1_PHACM|nr:hypothetical protein UCRPC4_g03750 [Phaeomoniella chlamydospora]
MGKHYLTPNGRKLQREKSQGLCQSIATNQNQSFEVAEDEEGFNAINEADTSSSQFEHDTIGQGNDGSDIQARNGLAQSETNTSKRSDKGEHVWYDGNEQFSGFNLECDLKAIETPECASMAVPFVYDADLAELSPNVTPFRKGYSSGKKRGGFRTSPVKRRHCPSYYDEDIIPSGMEINIESSTVDGTRKGDETLKELDVQNLSEQLEVIPGKRPDDSADEDLDFTTADNETGEDEIEPVNLNRDDKESEEEDDADEIGHIQQP